MNEKKWMRTVLLGIVFILTILFLLTFIIDPVFHYHKPIKNMGYTLSDERYQNDGIAKNFSYDALITGTSMAENFKTSQFDDLFGTNSIKLCFCGAYYKEVNNIEKVAIRNNKNIKYVLRCLDYWMITNEKDAQAADNNPEYLYNNNIFDDVYYWFNKDILFNKTMNVISNSLHGYTTTTFDEYTGSWSSPRQLGREAVLNSIVTRTEKSDVKFELTEEEKMLEKGNLEQNVIAVVKENPDITFYYFFSPYSICYYDMLYQQGRLKWHFQTEKLAIEELLQYKNIKLFSFSNNYDIVCNLDNYADMGHYSSTINEKMLNWMFNGEYQLTKDNYEAYLEEIEQFYSNYDYDSIWAGWGE